MKPVTHALVLAVLAASLGTTHAAIPATVSFTARVVDDATGKPITGSHHVSFELFDAASNGHAVWMEGQDIDVDEDGLIYLALGAIKPLDGTVFDGKTLYLAVTLDDATMDPRIPLASVPYSIRAGAADKADKADTADKIGGMVPGDFQKRVTGICNPGSFVTVINPDGTVTCAAGATGTGDITSVIAGSGLAGGGTAGDVTLSLISTCTANQILKWSGTAWACATDAVGTGDITGVLVGPGLMGGGTTGDVTLSLLTTCSMNQLLKWNGTTWVCATDLDTDTNSGGTITAVNVTPASGLVGGGTTGAVSLSLPLTCASGQMLKWNGSAWACANDLDTAGGGGGTITDVIAGNGLTGGGATGSVTLNVVGGSGIVVNADNIAVDFTGLDARYVFKTGDTMSGLLNMNNNQVTNRGCGTGYTRMGPGLCIEAVDIGGLTFTGAANRCRAGGSHLCSSGEMRSVLASGISLSPSTTYLDWIDDQDADDSALYVNSSAQDPNNLEGAQSTTSTGYSRCCRNVE